VKRTVNQGEEGLVKNSFDFQETWQGHMFFLIWRFFAHLFYLVFLFGAAEKNFPLVLRVKLQMAYFFTTSSTPKAQRLA